MLGRLSLHLQPLADLLWPRVCPYLVGTCEAIRCEGKYCIPYETGLIMFMYRMVRPRRIRPDTEIYFSVRCSKISRVIRTFSNALYQVANKYLSDPSLFRHRFRLYSDLITAKTNGAATNIWGFIDGTLRKTCRPVRFQKVTYSGHKRNHGIKFQSVATPDGLIALLFGPMEGSRHDSMMLTESRLLRHLEELMPEGTELFSIYGDPAYPISPHLLSGFKNVPPGSVQQQWNTQMSKGRQMVEWEFKEVATKWSYVDFEKNMKIFKCPIAQYYTVAVFFTNLCCCCYGNQSSKYFGCNTRHDGKMGVQEYLELVD
jgi:nuclease HARBI1